MYICNTFFQCKLFSLYVNDNASNKLFLPEQVRSKLSFCQKIDTLFSKNSYPPPHRNQMVAPLGCGIVKICLIWPQHFSGRYPNDYSMKINLTCTAIGLNALISMSLKWLGNLSKSNDFTVQLVDSLQCFFNWKPWKTVITNKMKNWYISPTGFSQKHVLLIWVSYSFCDSTILSTANRIPLGGSSKKGSHVYFLLQVFWVILLFCQMILLFDMLIWCYNGDLTSQKYDLKYIWPHCDFGRIILTRLILLIAWMSTSLRFWPYYMS